MSTSTKKPKTKETDRRCPHCGEWHTVAMVVEPGWERMVYCKRTGTVA